MEYSLKGIFEYLSREGIDSKHILKKELMKATSTQLKGIEHDLRIIIVKKVMEERKGK